MDACITNPFTILIDTAESQPWSFHGLYADADKGDAPLFVPTRWECLGRHPHSLGDYSIDGLQGQVAIERKSMEDAWSTVLGWDSNYHVERGIDGRRNRFKRELANLAAIRAGIVIVEAPLERCLVRMPGADGLDYNADAWEGSNEQRGVHTVRENRKIFFRSVVSWQERFKVNWFFCADRRAAEIFAFRWLEKHWQHHLERLDRRERRELRAQQRDQKQDQQRRAVR